jgi:hypothetical protein
MSFIACESGQPSKRPDDAINKSRKSKTKIIWRSFKTVEKKTNNFRGCQHILGDWQAREF